MDSSVKRIVVLISGRGSNLGALIDAARQPDFSGKICAVISNRADAGGLALAQRAGIATRIVRHQDHESRDDFDKALIQVIDEVEPDLVVLAGFMRILTAHFVNHYAGRLLNIHPSLLPAYKGLNTHQRAIEDHAVHHGASVHFVSAGVDDGAIVIQAVVPVLHGDTSDTLAARVLDREHHILPLAVRWFVEGRLYLRGDSAYLDDHPLEQPIRI